jgi:hypothetical protein
MQIWDLSDSGTAGGGFALYIPIAMQQAKVLKEKALTESEIVLLTDVTIRSWKAARTVPRRSCPLLILMGKKSGKTFTENIRARK